MISLTKNIFAVSALIVLCVSNFAYAQVRYIDDSIQIPLRSGATTQHRIIRFLNSGTKVDFKNFNADDNKWAFVSLNASTEGWVQSRYLKNTPAAKELLINSEAAVKKLKTSNAEKNTLINELKAEVKALQSELEILSKTSDVSTKELDRIKEISKNAIRLDQSNTTLLEDNELLKASIENVTQQFKKLESSEKNRGILYGMLAVVLGIIFGWIMPKMGSRKSDGWT